MRLRSCGTSPRPSAQSQARWPSLGCWAKAISSCRFRARNAASTLRRMPAPWMSNSATTTWLAWRPHYALKPCPAPVTMKSLSPGSIANLSNPGESSRSLLSATVARNCGRDKIEIEPIRSGRQRGFNFRGALTVDRLIGGDAIVGEPIALALDHEGVAVMQESIEDGGGDDVVAEDLTPLRHALIRRDQHRRFLVAMAHELKEEMGTLAFERHVAELVDDEQLRFAVEEHPTREDALALAVDEVGEERRRRGGGVGLHDPIGFPIAHGPPDARFSLV